MALTASQKNEFLQIHTNTKHVGLGIEGTFYAGECVMMGGDDALIKPVSASTVAGCVGVGIITEQQTVAAGGYVTYYSGMFNLSGSGFTGVDINKPVFCGDSALGVFDTQATNRIIVGRYRGLCTTYGTNNGLFEIGNMVSGTLATTAY